MENGMNKDKEVKVESVSVDDATPNAPTTETNLEIEKLSAQLAEMNDKYLRLAAELENTRRRSELDAQSRARNRAISVAEKSVINDNPNTVIPGVSVLISNKFTGIFA